MKLELKYVSAAEALSIIQSNQRVFIHGSTHNTTYLLKHLAEEHNIVAGLQKFTPAPLLP
jgi:DeoR/GlpR family transcriptional regulator of sugar metabolism